MAPNELHRARETTQEKLAETLQVNQTAVSKLERRTDMLSTAWYPHGVMPTHKDAAPQPLSKKERLELLNGQEEQRLRAGIEEWIHDPWREDSYEFKCETQGADQKYVMHKLAEECREAGWNAQAHPAGPGGNRWTLKIS